MHQTAASQVMQAENHPGQGVKQHDKQGTAGVNASGKTNITPAKGSMGREQYGIKVAVRQHSRLEGAYIHQAWQGGSAEQQPGNQH